MAKNLCGVSHPRSGVNWILKTIFVNFNTPYNSYRGLFSTHHPDIKMSKKTHPRAYILHISRDIQPVLMSVFRMRERNGIAENFDSFSTFLRTKYTDMPRTKKKTTKMLWHGKMEQQKTVSWIGKQPMTPPELWLLVNQYWTRYANCTITYEKMQQDQESILAIVSNATQWKRKQSKKLENTIGLVPPNNKAFDVSRQDEEYLNQFRESFIEWGKNNNE